MEPMVVMAARAAQLVGQELLKAHQNRHKLDLQVEEKGIDGENKYYHTEMYLVDNKTFDMEFVYLDVYVEVKNIVQ